MHIVVSFDVSAGLDREAIVEKLVAVIKPYEWVRPLTTFYIVKANEADRQLISAGLRAVAQANDPRVEVLVSPVMQGGYEGALPQPRWGQINSVTL